MVALRLSTLSWRSLTEVPTQWIDSFERMYGSFLGDEGFSYLQKWLSTQETDESGCPLVDNPFIFSIGELDDNV